MLVLDDVTQTLQGVLGGAIATTQPDFYAAWRDITTTDYTPGQSDGQLNSTTDVDLIVAPAASTQRVIDYLSVFNRDTASVTLTIKTDSSGTERWLWSGTLATNEKVEYVEGTGFRVLDATGVVKGVGATGAPGAPGGGTVLGSGTSIVDFGDFPGTTDAELDVTGLTNIQAGSQVMCWIAPVATADHSADEHLVEPLFVYAIDIVAGVGFTLRVVTGNQRFEAALRNTYHRGTVAARLGPGQRRPGQVILALRDPEVWGEWTIGWLYTQ
jgi:hypothetical protein